MNQFKEYLLTEYQVKNAKAIKFSFSHSQTIKKTDKVPRIDNLITVRIKFFDENANTIQSNSITFENNIIPKSKEKSLINIAPKELNNRFGAAKQEICSIIKQEYMAKIDELNEKLNKLQQYCSSISGRACNTIIPQKFEGESITLTNETIVGKKVFDM